VINFIHATRTPRVFERENSLKCPLTDLNQFKSKRNFGVMSQKITTFQKAISMLTPREKKTGLWVLGLIVIKGIGDVISVATVMPFLSLLGTPELVNTNPIANYFYALFGFESIDSFVFMVGIAIVVILVSISALRSLTAYALNRWIFMREYTLSRRILTNYISQPYEFFLDHHTDNLKTYILNESRRVVAEAYKPAAEIMNALMTFVMVVAFLIWAEPVTTLVSVLAFGLCYGTLYLSLRSLLRRMGNEVLLTNKARFRVTGEVLGGIKQIKLLGREQNYVSAFSKPAKRQAQVRAINATLRQIPKFGLEAIAFGGIIILTLMIVARNGGVESGAIASSLPTLGLYAFAGYRLLPTMQVMYASFATLKYGAAAVDAIYDDLNNTEATKALPKVMEAPLRHSQSVAFKNISYQYPGTDEGGLKNISFEIKKGMTIGVVGTTGAGKTTLVDVFLGLLPATSGEIIVDDKVLTEDLMLSWQSSIGYVPQDIFLVDASIRENIALGVPKEEIDHDAVRQAAVSAQIFDFIENQMPDGFDTHVGERGVRISGGQRQRIGIARALYHNPQIVVFDEATSALDNTTERELMNEINTLSEGKTLIMIAHRLSTVEKCDFILVLDKGQLVGMANYDELLAENTYFQSLTH